MSETLAKRIEANRRVYERLLKDSSYTAVRFNPHNGALSAIHEEHQFDPNIGIFGIPRGDYERIAVDVLYDYGKSVILGSEKSELNRKFPEGFLDDKRFDIKGVEGVGGRNIIDKISYAGKQGAEIVVLYFHDAAMFDKQKIINAYNGYLNLSKTKRIQGLYYIVDKKLHRVEV